MSVTLELVRNVTETGFESFDASVVDKARSRIMDVVGCMIGGAHAPGCDMLLSLVKEWGGKEEGTIIAHGLKVPAHNAALVNSVMARSYDFEPTGPFVDGKSTPAHISGTTVPTALTVAGHKGASGRELLTALILGDDLASRVIAASKANIDSGFDSTGTVNALGAAAIAGRLRGLKEQQLLNAFGIVLNQFGGTFQNIFDGAHTFKLPQGLAAQAGVFSASLAEKGFTGVKDPLFSRYGYFALYCKSYQPEVLTKNLGKEFYADVTCKPYPCCRSNHAAIECVLDILRTSSIRPEDIDEVVVDITPTARDFAVGQRFRIREVAQIDAAFSLQYTVANALLRKSVKLEHFTEEFIRDPKIMEIVPKIRLTANMPPSNPLGAGVRIRTKEGGEHERRVDMPRGSGIFTPLTPAEKREKYFQNVAFSKTISMDKAEKALGMIDRLEEVADVSDLVKQLIQ